ELNDASAQSHWGSKKTTTGAGPGNVTLTTSAPEAATSGLGSELQQALSVEEKTIKPTRIGGFLCAQFDLDLFVLSGGVFPGLIGIGLLGEIHYQQATSCYGWTAELYLMLSIGVTILGVDFRVALVVIATLVVTERPLAAGAKELVWELPPNFDINHCMSSSPFSLVTATTKQGRWKFIYTHILTKKYLQHAEVQLHQYFKDNKQELTEFQRYVDFIEPPQALPASIVSANQSRGLAKEGIVGNVVVQGVFGEDFIDMTVLMPRELRAELDYEGRGVSTNIFKHASSVRARIWQRFGDLLLSQKSEPCRSPAKSNYQCKFRLAARKDTMAFVQLTVKTFQEFAIPMQLDNSRDEFHFPASMRTSKQPQATTLSCQRLFVTQSQKECSALKSVDLEVKVGDTAETASWEPQQFGEDEAPWGISMPMGATKNDHPEIDEKLAGAPAANVWLHRMTSYDMKKFFIHARDGFCQEREERFLRQLWDRSETPSPDIASLIPQETLAKIVGDVLRQLQLDYRNQTLQAKEQDTLVGAHLVNALQITDEMKQLLEMLSARSFSDVPACAERAIEQAIVNVTDRGALLRGLQSCSALSRLHFDTNLAAKENVIENLFGPLPAEGRLEPPESRSR
ncbi:unnamed protein product, partial [Effrenium voratum]